MTLSEAGLDLPSVDHLSNMGSLNVVLDRAFNGVPVGIPPNHAAIGLFMTFVRLTDKALREYDAARAELSLYVIPYDGLRTSPYLRAIDHFENCVGALHRAVLSSKQLRLGGVGRSAPRLTARQEDRLAHLRNAFEHSDEKIIGAQKFKNSPPFSRDQPHSLRLANTRMVIGGWELTYCEIVNAMVKMHRTIELIRATPTGTPGPDFPNAVLRTAVPARATSGGMRASDYLKELTRLQVTH